MTADIRRERIRRAGEIARLDLPEIHDSEALAGVVVTASTTAGNYLKWNPQTVLGTETEGGSGSFTTRSFDLRALFLGPGIAVAGDQLIFRHVNYRWVCEKKAGGGSGYACDYCGGLPSTLYLHYAPSGTTITTWTMTYGRPGFLTRWTAPDGPNYYVFECYTNITALFHYVNSSGTLIYGGNVVYPITCSPFDCSVYFLGSPFGHIDTLP